MIFEDYSDFEREYTPLGLPSYILYILINWRDI